MSHEGDVHTLLLWICCCQPLLAGVLRVNATQTVSPELEMENVIHLALELLLLRAGLSGALGGSCAGSVNLSPLKSGSC